MHLRRRHVQRILSKRLKVFPVLGLVGPRQVGKTTFLMQEWQARLKAQYVTLDKSDVAKRAKREPENFLLSGSDDLQRRLIIDEAQKAPGLFDSIKAIIDERRRIGIFTVSGSVEFSDKAGIRESLAGRLGICRLYPLTMCELAQQSLQTPWVHGLKEPRWPRTAKQVDDWLLRGGMPIFCPLHDRAEATLAIESWLDAICHRDLQQLKGTRLDGDIAKSMFSAIAREPSANLSQIAHNAGASRAAVAKHLSALEALFLVHRLPSLDNRNAAPDYALFDCAVLRYLLGNGDEAFMRHQTLRTLAINEILAQHEYSGEEKPGLFYYRSRGGAEIDLVLKNKKGLLGIQISIASDVTPYSLRGMQSFLASHSGAKGVVLAPVVESFNTGGIRIVPWIWIG